MISDITLGQFFPGFSPLHKLDPRTKILLSILYIVVKMSDTCDLFPPFGDPWPSCLLPSHIHDHRKNHSLD